MCYKTMFILKATLLIVNVTIYVMAYSNCYTNAFLFHPASKFGCMNIMIHPKNRIARKYYSSRLFSSSSSFISNATDSSPMHNIYDDAAASTMTVADIPQRTEAGGYTHTRASKAKISAANKGKIPWNKGVQRPEDVKARIAEGVRRKNRERFLEQLATLGITEDEYMAQKQRELEQKQNEKLLRKTAKGGYRATDETRAKISLVLKEKYANRNVTKRVYNGPFRKGFAHTEETKEKIRSTLRKRWAEDSDYQNKMKKASTKNTHLHIREKISQTLKEKWQDPDFRSKMIQSIQQRERKTASLSTTQKERISEAMKKKWQDSDYRFKALLKRNGTVRNSSDDDGDMSSLSSSSRHTLGGKTDRFMDEHESSTGISKKKRINSSTKISLESSPGVIAVTPLQPISQKILSNIKSSKTITEKTKNVPSSSTLESAIHLSNTSHDNKTKRTRKSKQSYSGVTLVQALSPNPNKPLSIDMDDKMIRGTRVSDSTTRTRQKQFQQEQQLLQNRRDSSSLEIYLNHSDEDDRLDDDFMMNLYSESSYDIKPYKSSRISSPSSSSSSASSSTSSKTLDSIFDSNDDDDENLDNFDPYGLDNF